MLAGIYCRVSTQHQFKEGYSIAEQEAAIRFHVQRKGDRIVQVWHEDISGVTLSRPKLDEILALARGGGIQVLYAYDLDRLARGPVAVNMIEEQLKRLGVRIEYVRVDFDDSPEGQLLKMIMATFSGYEREKTRERSMRGKVGKAKAGKTAHGGKRAYGYAFDEQDRYVIVENEAAIVRMIFEWYTVQKMGTIKIADELNRRGITAYSKLNWSSTSISRMLKSELYAGRYIYNKTTKVGGKIVTRPRSEWIVVPVPAIVSDEVFNAAQQQMESNKTFSKRNTKHNYLLSGMLFCATCGLRYYGTANGPKTKPQGRYRYLCGGIAKNNLFNKVYTCPSTTLNADTMDALVWSRIRDMLVNPDRIVQALAGAESAHKEQITALNEQLDILRIQFEGVSKAEKKLIELFALSDIDTDVVGVQLAEYKQRKAQIEGAVADIQGQMSAKQKTLKTEDVLRLCKTIAKNIDRFTFEEKREALKLLEVKVWVDRTKTPMSVKISGLLPDEIDSQSPRRLLINFTLMDGGLIFFAA